jgi:hypothetical protein
MYLKLYPYNFVIESMSKKSEEQTWLSYQLKDASETIINLN